MQALPIKIITITLVAFIITHQAVAQKTAMGMVKEAKTQITALSPQEVLKAIADSNVVLIDIRDAEELPKGKIARSVHASRGMLEFYADSTVSHYKPVFKKDKKIIVYCTSSSRSALAAKTLLDMGYLHVYNLEGGLNAWEKAGLPLEKK